jgi:hypothetical protein
MTKCNIFYTNDKKCVLFVNYLKGFTMSLMVKNAQSWLEKFENRLETIAERLF